MAMKELRYRAFKGIHNRLPPDRLPAGFVADALNGYFDRAMAFRSLPGPADSTSGAVTAISGQFCILDGELAEIDSSGASSLATPLGGGILRHAAVGATTYITDGVVCVRVVEGAVEHWGLPVPSTPAPALTSGALAAGTYLVATCFVDGYGVESGLSTAAVAHVAAGGFTLTAPATFPAGAVSLHVYVSDCDGTALFYHGATASPGSTYQVLTHTISGAMAQTMNMEPPPASSALTLWNGCIVAAVGTEIRSSMPFAHDLWDRLRSRDFGSDVTAIAGLPGGLVIGTTKNLWFLSGGDLSDGALVNLADVSVPAHAPALVNASDLVFNNQPLPSGAVVVTARGVVFVSDDGQLQELTKDFFVPAVGENANVFAAEFDDSWQLVALGDSGFVMSANTAVARLDLGTTVAGFTADLLWTATDTALRSHAGAGIPASITTAEADFGSEEMKCVSQVWVERFGENDIALTATADGVVQNYTIPASSAVVGRTVLARGARGRRWQLKLESTGDFQLKSIDTVAAVSSLRRTR